MYIACLNLRGTDLVTSISSLPNCRSGSQEWLFKGPHVCLVTLPLLQPIVTQNMCFHGHNADHAHVHCLAVAKQLRMNRLDDLFVPTDVIQFSIQVLFVQSMPHSGSDSRLWIQQVCAFTHRLLAALSVPPSLRINAHLPSLSSWLIG